MDRAGRDASGRRESVRPTAPIPGREIPRTPAGCATPRPVCALTDFVWLQRLQVRIQSAQLGHLCEMLDGPHDNL